MASTIFCLPANTSRGREEDNETLLSDLHQNNETVPASAQINPNNLNNKNTTSSVEIHNSDAATPISDEQNRLNNRLFNAIRDADVIEIRSLLNSESSKADVNAVNSWGSSPLHLAAANGKIELVRLLLEYKPNLTARNRKDQTARDLAKFFGNTEIVKLLDEAMEKKSEKSN